jgi:hypothetical protein
LIARFAQFASGGPLTAQTEGGQQFERGRIVRDVTHPAVIAHVYSSADSYAATPRSLTPVWPSSAVGSVTVEVGRAPRWLYRASQRLLALDILRDGSLATWLQGGSDPKFRLPAGRIGSGWYTTFILELPPVRLDVEELDKAMEHEAVLAEAAVLFAASSSGRVIAKRELRGLFMQRLDGKWVKYPTFETFPPTVGVGHPEAALQVDLRAAEVTLRSWRVGTAAAIRIDWALKALLTDEPWSEFVWLMFSLEQVIQDHQRSNRPTAATVWRANAEAYVRAVVPRTAPDWSRPSITMRFAALAAHLSPKSGAGDTAAFHRLKRIRDSMLHGTQSEAPDGATRLKARDLTLKYNKLFALSSSKASQATARTMP